MFFYSAQLVAYQRAKGRQVSHDIPQSRRGHHSPWRSCARCSQPTSERAGEPESVAGLTGAAATTSASDKFVTIQNQDETMTLQVPAAWTDVSQGAWTVHGVQVGYFLSASTNLADFQAGRSAPGVFMGVFSGHAKQDASALLDTEKVDISKRCSLTGRKAYKDQFYVGNVDDYTQCGGARQRSLVSVVQSGDGSTVLFARQHRVRSGRRRCQSDLLQFPGAWQRRRARPRPWRVTDAYDFARRNNENVPTDFGATSETRVERDTSRCGGCDVRLVRCCRRSIGFLVRRRPRVGCARLGVVQARSARPLDVQRGPFSDIGIHAQAAQAQGYNALFLTDHDGGSSFLINNETANHRVFEDKLTNWTASTFGTQSGSINALATTPHTSGTSSLHLASTSMTYGETGVWSTRGPNFRSGDIILKVKIYPKRIDANSGVYVSASIGGDLNVVKHPKGYTTTAGVISPEKTTVLVWQLGDAAYPPAIRTPG